MLVKKEWHLAAALGAALLSAGCQDAGTKNAVAVYSYSDGPCSETVTLRPDGKYVQSETQRDDGQPVAGQPSLLPLTLKRTGAWRLLDGPGGRTLPLPPSADALPPGAVVELRRAMPFGTTWERSSFPGKTLDRTVPANEFKIQH